MKFACVWDIGAFIAQYNVQHSERKIRKQKMVGLCV